MFKFNFSSEISTQDCSSNSDKALKSDVEWDEAKEIDLPVTSSEANCLDLPALRLFKFDEISVKLLKRENALLNIEKDLESSKCAIEAEKNNSDLLPAKYEGGLKVWECSEDLGDYIVKQLSVTKIKGKDVLDLGCGAGLVGILALQLGANSVTFQDYNQEVLTHWTCPNVSINCQDVSKHQFRFWSGDWGSFSEKCPEKFDFIFTSETIYNPDNYDKLCQIFQRHMNVNSVVYLAAKSVYFSLGGSVQLFLSEINKRGKDFVFHHVFKSDEGVQRVIVEIRRNVSAHP